jgi:hypothetical protein
VMLSASSERETFLSRQDQERMDITTSKEKHIFMESWMVAVLGVLGSRMSKNSRFVDIDRPT